MGNSALIMRNLLQLTPLPNKSITKLYCSDTFTIYSDDDYKNIYAAGYNEHGQCSIGNFKNVF